MTSGCLTSSDSATMERAPPGPNKRAIVTVRLMERITRSRIAGSCSESTGDNKPCHLLDRDPTLEFAPHTPDSQLSCCEAGGLTQGDSYQDDHFFGVDFLSQF